MLKVFLVEDEYIIREAIRKTVNWEKEGYELVGEAGDGERDRAAWQECNRVSRHDA